MLPELQITHQRHLAAKNTNLHILDYKQEHRQKSEAFQQFHSI